MNGYSFATSREAGFMVLWIVISAAMVVLIVGALVLEFRENRRRTARVRDARAQRDAGVRTFPAGASMRILRPGNRAGLDGDRHPPAARARLSGVDEMQIDDCSLWAERSR